MNRNKDNFNALVHLPTGLSCILFFEEVIIRGFASDILLFNQIHKKAIELTFLIITYGCQEENILMNCDSWLQSCNIA